ncbi:hypothetical protein M2403_004529 [Rahnella sp. BIGb0603]|nr:hypothetical protein [Rahnella sp. BIGb0603]
MAFVIRMKDESGSRAVDGAGLNHLVGINHATLCGWCDAGEWSDLFIGDVTCGMCRKEAYNVFQGCKKSEVK